MLSACDTARPLNFLPVEWLLMKAVNVYQLGDALSAYCKLFGVQQSYNFARRFRQTDIWLLLCMAIVWNGPWTSCAIFGRIALVSPLRSELRTDR